MPIKFGGFVDYLCSFSTNHSQTISILLFLAVSTDFQYLLHVLRCNTVEGIIPENKPGGAHKRCGLFSECDAMYYRDCGRREVNIFAYSKNPDHA